MRWMLILALAATVYYFQFRSSNVVHFTGIPAYNEVRMNIDVPGRDIELVVYLKRDSYESCDAAERWFLDVALKCASRGDCHVKERACLEYIPEQYVDMFAQQPARTSYLKLANPVNRREGVLLLWGLSRQESIETCQFLLKRTRELTDKKDSQIQSLCVDQAG